MPSQPGAPIDAPSARSPSTTVSGPLLLGACLAASFIWPSQGNPFAGLICGLASMLIALWGFAAVASCRGASVPGVGALAMGGLWTAWAVAGAWRAEVPPAHAAFSAQALIGFWMFLGAAWWSSLGRPSPADPSSGPSIHSRALLWSVALIAAGMSLYAIWQRYAGYERLFQEIHADPSLFANDVELREAVEHAMRENRPGGTFYMPNLAAALMALGAGLSLALIGISRRKLAWLSAGVIAAACVFGAALTQSRGGMLTLAAGLGGGALLLWRRGGAGAAPARKPAWVAWAALGASAALLAGLLFLFAASPLGAEWRRRLTAASTIQARLNYWQAAWAMFTDRPIAGHGADAFALLYPQYRLPGATEARYPHNWAARFGAELGAVGVTLFAGWIGSVGWAAARRRRSGARDPAALAALFGAALLLLNGMFEYSLSCRELYMALCLLLGVAAGGETGAAQTRRVSAILSAALAALALAAAWPFQWREDRTEVLRNESRKASALAGAARASGNGLEAFAWGTKAVDKLAAAATLEPRNPWILDTIALMFAYQPETLDLARAEQTSVRAVSLHPRSATMRVHHSWILETLGRPEDALSEADRAVELHPLDPEPYENRAVMLERRGRIEEALADARRALELRKTSPHIAAALVERLESRLRSPAPGD